MTSSTKPVSLETRIQALEALYKTYENSHNDADIALSLSQIDPRDADLIKIYTNTLTEQATQPQASSSLSGMVQPPQNPHPVELAAIGQAIDVLRSRQTLSSASSSAQPSSYSSSTTYTEKTEEDFTESKEEAPRASSAAVVKQKEEGFLQSLLFKDAPSILGEYLLPEEMARCYAEDKTLTLASDCIKKYELMPFIKNYFSQVPTTEEESIKVLDKLLKLAECACIDLTLKIRPDSYADLERALTIIEDLCFIRLFEEIFGRQYKGFIADNSIIGLATELRERMTLESNRELCLAVESLSFTNRNGVVRSIPILPKEISLLPNLKSIDVLDCHILPIQISYLEKLTGFHASRNYLTEMPPLPPNLETLWLGACGSFTEFPSSIAQLTHLTQIIVLFTGFKELTVVIPDAFATAASACVRKWHTELAELQAAMRPLRGYLSLLEGRSALDLIPLLDSCSPEFRNAVYGFTYHLAKRAGITTDHHRYGELAFRQQDARNVDHDLRMTAINCALLEQVIIPLLEGESSDATAQALLLFHILNNIEKHLVFDELCQVVISSGRRVNDTNEFGQVAFMKTKQMYEDALNNILKASRTAASSSSLWAHYYRVSDALRIQAIRNFLKKHAYS